MLLVSWTQIIKCIFRNTDHVALVVFIGHSGEGGQRRDPQGHVLAPVLGPGAEQVHRPGFLEQLVQRLQPGQLPQAADAAH